MTSLQTQSQKSTSNARTNAYRRTRSLKGSPSQMPGNTLRTEVISEPGN